MTRSLLIFALVATISPAVAHGVPLSTQPPEKPDRVVVPPPADPETIRQGGDTIGDATVIAGLPYDTTGTTAGYTDDYDEVCPYDTPGSPDVVYSFTPAGDILLGVDLCGSSYDTKLYIYDSALNVIACNDDYYFDEECGVYVSALYAVQLIGGEPYAIVIDGYGGEFGEYILAVSEVVPCLLDCPPEGFSEGEPDLVDDYVDEFNCGCSCYAGGPPAFQGLNFGPAYVEFCGVAGWYLFEGSMFRDTDWFTAVIGELGFIEVSADAESGTLVVHLAVTEDCQISILQNIAIGPCAPDDLVVVGDPGEVVYLFAASSDFWNPGYIDGNMYDYILTLDGLEGTAIESRTWSQVKGLYR